jgi:hypothetical protein
MTIPPEDQRPVRVFRIGYEKQYLLEKDDLEAELYAEWMGSEADLETESLNIAHELESMQLWIADPKKRAFALPFKFISQLVISTAINGGFEHRASYPKPPHTQKHRGTGAPKVEYEPQVDFYEELRRFLLQSRRRIDWDQDDKRNLRYVRKVLMQVVTAEKTNYGHHNQQRQFRCAQRLG